MKITDYQKVQTLDESNIVLIVTMEPKQLW